MSVAGGGDSAASGADGRGTRAVLEMPTVEPVRASLGLSAFVNDQGDHGPIGELLESGAAAGSRLEAAAISGHFGPSVPREGRTASVSGTLRRVDRPGERFTLSFDAGPNKGLEIGCGEDGSFVATDLYPGFAMVTAWGSDGSRCTRELLLRHRKVVDLSVDLGGFGLVTGAVRSDRHAPIAGAVVSLDGHETITDAEGGYRIARRASGNALLIVSAPGFTSYSERLPLPASGDTLALVVLRDACAMEITVPPIAGARGDAMVYVFPTGAQRLSGRMPAPAYPWHRLNPLQVPPGTTVLLDDLPATRVDVYVFHPQARSRPTFAWTILGDVVQVPIEMEALPTLTGQVLLDGEPVAGAPVSLAFANGMAASQAALGPAASSFYKSQPVEFPPQIVQRAVTDVDGCFVLGLDDHVRSETGQFVTVAAPGGELTVTRQLSSPVRELVFELATPEESSHYGFRSGDL